MGRSRSASLVMMYMMYKFKISADEAFNYVQSKRNVIDPNKGFRKALYQFEEMVKNGYRISRKKEDGAGQSSDHSKKKRPSNLNINNTFTNYRFGKSTT